MSARSPLARLIDNVRRRQRRLREKMRDPNAEQIDVVGFKRNIGNIEKFIKELKRKDKAGTLDINEAVYQTKENTSLSGNVREIRKNTMKMIYAQSDSTWEAMGNNPLFSDLFAEYAALSEMYVGISAEGEDYDKAHAFVEKVKETIAKHGAQMSPDDISRLNALATEMDSATQSKGWALGHSNPIGSIKRNN